MKQVVLVGTLVAALGAGAVSVSAQFAPPAAGASLGTVTLNRRVMADGKPLAPGTYQVRLTGETPKPGVGQSPDGERYIEFMRGGKVRRSRPRRRSGANSRNRQPVLSKKASMSD